MRHGSTLIEFMVAIAVLAVVVSVSLRLLYTSDRALQGEAARAASAGGVARLLADLGEDLREASSVSGGGEALAVRGTRGLRYYWDDEQQATVRQGFSAQVEMRVYPGVRVEFKPGGSLVRVHISSGSIAVRTTYYLRNR